MIFCADPGVLFCSVHAHPADGHPNYLGSVDERGVASAYTTSKRAMPSARVGYTTG